MLIIINQTHFLCYIDNHLKTTVEAYKWSLNALFKIKANIRECILIFDLSINLGLTLNSTVIYIMCMYHL
jgi:hypothetical protein